MLLKSYSFAFLVSQLLSYSAAAPKKIIGGKNIEIQLVFPENVTQPGQCLNTNVLIINHTDTVVSFFEDWNMWGYFNLYFQIRSGDSTYSIYKKDKDWPKNFPSYKTLFPGDTLKLKYSLDYGDCKDSQFDRQIPTKSNELNTIKAFYKLHPEMLKLADLKGKIKYKYSYGRGSMIIDSLKTPVEINRTFPLAILESKEYKL